jgi:YD repeat-containing protein
MARSTVYSACRDCSQSGFGGPQENRFTAFEAVCPGDLCRDPGVPQVFVNLSNLTLFVRVLDLPFGGPAPALALERSYNSDDTSTGPFGTGWAFSLGDTLTVSSDGSLLLRRASGRIDQFAPSSSGAIFALTSTTDTLGLNANGSYTLRAAGSATTRTFSPDGRLLAIQDGGATRVALEYDASNRLTVARYRGGALNFSYDDNARINAVADSAGRTVSYSYTADGHLDQQTNADGRTVQYQYDGTGRLTGLTSGGGTIGIAYAGDSSNSWVAGVTTVDGTRQFDVPVSPGQTRVRDAAGNATLYSSSASGLLQSVTDPYGNTVSYSYDAAGRRTRVVNAAGEASTLIYDAKGNLTAITDGANLRWQADYNNAGLLAHITDPRGSVWTFLYDSAGNLVSVKTPNNDAATATLSATGQITAFTGFLGNKNSYEYSSDGLVRKWVDALGGAWTFEYDGAARAVSRTDPGNGTLRAVYGTGLRPVRLGADDIVSPATPDGAQRDALSRLTGYIDSYGNRVAYTYGSTGRLSSMTLPGDKKVAYEYDKAGRLSQVTDWLGNFAIYRYDAAGSTASVTVSGGPATIYQYDSARRLRAIVSAGPDGSPVAAYRYTLDNTGNRIAVNSLEPSAAPLVIAPVSTTFDAANRPSTRSDNQAYRYDLRGNLKSIEGARNVTFGYDAFGRLTSVQGETSVTSGYDSSGLRVSRTSNGVERHFVYDLSGPARLVVETDASNVPVAWYVYGLGLLWKVTADDATYFYHFDGDGNVVAVSNAAAGVVNRYRYDPWGQLVTANQTVENLFRMRGESGWVDDANGLVYNLKAFVYPELKMTLPAAADPSPPQPSLLPVFSGAGACFLEGAAKCAFAGGQR